MNYRAGMEMIGSHLRFVKRAGVWHILVGFDERRAFCGRLSASKVRPVLGGPDTLGSLCPICTKKVSPKKAFIPCTTLAKLCPTLSLPRVEAKKPLKPLAGQMCLLEYEELERRAAKMFGNDLCRKRDWLRDLGVYGWTDWIEKPIQELREATEALESEV